MAIQPTSLTATERIDRKVQTLDYMKAHLIELNKMAANDRLDMLCYLIEMAIAEADTTILNHKARAILPQRSTPTRPAKR